MDFRGFGVLNITKIQYAKLSKNYGKITIMTKMIR